MRALVGGRAALSFLLCAYAGLSLVSVSAGSSSSDALQIKKLDGSVVKVGTWGSGAFAHPLYGVRLRATVCFRSASEALNAYPSSLTIIHYSVNKSRSTWWRARTVIDHPPWLVPFGETWHGRRCGPVALEDPLPSEHYGVESVGNPNACYGVSLTIRVGANRATRRAIITCGPRFGPRALQARTPDDWSVQAGKRLQKVGEYTIGLTHGRAAASTSTCGRTAACHEVRRAAHRLI
jgi:hypothetical protein